MEPSPKVPAPNAGDQMTAAWASLVADAANAGPMSQSRPGALSTPYGSAEPPHVAPMLGEYTMPMPFDCRIVRVEGDSFDSLFVWLSNNGAPLVSWNGHVVSPAQGQSIGTATSGWVRVGDLENGEQRFVHVALSVDDGGVARWSIEDTDAAWDGSFPPKITIATYNVAEDSAPPTPGTDNHATSGRVGLVQFHRGAIVDSDWTPDSSVAPEQPDAEHPANYSLDLRADGVAQLRRFDDPELLDASQVAQPDDVPDEKVAQFVIRVPDPSGNGARIAYAAIRTVEEEDPEPPAPPCGNPLNETDDFNPLDAHGSYNPGGGGTGNPLDDPGEGGFTPTCTPEN